MIIVLQYHFNAVTFIFNSLIIGAIKCMGLFILYFAYNFKLYLKCIRTFSAMLIRNFKSFPFLGKAIGPVFIVMLLGAYILPFIGLEFIHPELLLST